MIDRPTESWINCVLFACLVGLDKAEHAGIVDVRGKQSG